jgi:acetoacetyl-CoA synthetase
MKQALWQPGAQRIKNTALQAFLNDLSSRYGLSFDDYSSLHVWSCESPEQFWPALWNFLAIRHSRAATNVLSHKSRYPLPTFADWHWFEGARLNFAENLLRSAAEMPDKTALVSYLENGQRCEISYRQLQQQVARLAAAMRADGVVVGDRVVALMPNVIETVVAMLAATSIGAIWSSCSPDFGVQGVLDRFGQIQPKILLVADGYFYNGKTISLAPRIVELSAALPMLDRIVIVPVISTEIDKTIHEKIISIADYMASFSASEQIEFAQLPFDHPLYVLYSSGTTGVPKCIVHGAGGTLLQHLKELVLHTNIHAESVLFYFTTCGWMMWNWLVSALATGATVVLYDGSPFASEGKLLWDMVDREGITHFGTSAKYLATLEKNHIKPRQSHNLSSLITVLSTGSPLSAESFEFVYRDIKADLCLSSICGGTDIISSFVLGHPGLPVYAGEIQCKGLGMDVNVLSAEGKFPVAEKGELVCVKPFPSCPLGFWNDPEGAKFYEAYFAKNPGIWTHGDFAEITDNNGIVIHGRSDAVLNPGGVRIGTAEIYRQVEKIHEIIDSLVIGQQWQGDVRVVLFVVLRDGVALTDTLRQMIREAIRLNTTPRHVPEKIIAISEVPRTISGKIVELAVRNIIHKLPVKNTDALANPHALEQFRHLPELDM